MITQDSYRQRRETLMGKLKDSQGIVFLKGNSIIERNPDIEYAFRQNSSFKYFTGIDIPNMAMILDPREGKYILFGRETSFKERIWVGEQPSLEEIRQTYGADSIYPISSLDEFFERYMESSDILSLPSKDIPKEYCSNLLCDAVLNMRLVKSPEEISCIEKALEITAESHEAIMRATKSGMYEYNMKAIADYIYTNHNIFE